MGTELLPWVFTTGWASGINAYLVVLILGIAQRFFEVGQVPAVLGRTDVMVVAAVLFVLEMFADKIPYLDSVWDTVHTAIRPMVGATLGYLIGHESSSLDAAFSAATGGFTALAAHLVKAGTRAAVNTSPEPVSNVLVSSGEDVTVAGVVSLAFLNPWLAAAIAAVILIAGAFLLMFVFRKLSGCAAATTTGASATASRRHATTRRGGGAATTRSDYPGDEFRVGPRSNGLTTTDRRSNPWPTASAQRWSRTSSPEPCRASPGGSLATATSTGASWGPATRVAPASR